MNKIWVVARHEFSTTVKRIGFLLVTIGFPLLMAGIMGVSMMLQGRSAQQDRERIEKAEVGVIDRSGILTKPMSDKVGVKVESEEAGLQSLRGGTLEVLLVIPEDYLKTGLIRVSTTIRPSPFNFHESFIPPNFRVHLIDCILSQAEPDRVKRAMEPIAERRVEFLIPGTAFTENPDKYLKRLFTAGFFFFLIFTSISVAGGYLIQGMADEKENKVLEMVISSVTPTQLMAGKLIGLGAAGLLQVIVWSLMGITSVVWLVSGFALNPGLFAFCALFYILGYLLYGSLLLGVGSLGSNQREAMQYTWILTMTTMSPIFIWVTILGEPQSTIARVFTFIPLTTPTTIIMRYAIDPTGMPLWEILAAILLLVLSTILALRVSARLYRVGLLLYGKRPTPREIWRWMWSG